MQKNTNTYALGRTYELLDAKGKVYTLQKHVTCQVLILVLMLIISKGLSHGDGRNDKPIRSAISLHYIKKEEEISTNPSCFTTKCSTSTIVRKRDWHCIHQTTTSITTETFSGIHSFRKLKASNMEERRELDFGNAPHLLEVIPLALREITRVVVERISNLSHKRWRMRMKIAGRQKRTARTGPARSNTCVAGKPCSWNDW
jgi:hypothetical protein